MTLQPPFSRNVAPSTNLDLAPHATFSGVAAPTAEDASLRLTGILRAEGTVSDHLTYGEVRPPTIPGYQILRELGRGGMGVVYEARQLALNRLVALKVILGGAHADTETLQRFRTEAAAIARLAHPNIVQIFEIGEYDGLPYAALELVSGGGLDRYLRRQPQSPRVSAELVRTLALALQAAHDAGILHRDLKPANVLLAGGEAALVSEGVPKITDFGLAKRLDDEGASHTKTGVVVGTPGYMAPEQGSGKHKEVGPAADQYALGAILYEMLTGRPPFQGLTPMDTLMQSLTDEPVPPTRLQSAIPRDLETICLKALSKESARRYPSAAALAEDLRRFLHSEPITARPAGWLERGVKWARRRPAAAVAVGAALLMMLFTAGSALMLAFAWRSESAARQQAQTERDEAVKQRRRADDNYRLAFAALDLTAAKILDNKRLQEADSIDLRKELLTLCQPFFTQIAGQANDDRELEFHRAQAAGRLAMTQLELLELKEAEASARTQLAIMRKLAQADPTNVAYRKELAGSLLNVAFALGRQERRAEETAILSESRQQWLDLLKADPNDLDARKWLASLDYNAAMQASLMGQDDRAVELYVVAIARFEEMLKLAPGHFDAKYRLGMAQTNLALIRRHQGQLDEAGRLLEAARATKAALIQKQPRLYELKGIYAVCLYNLGQLREDERKLNEAEAAYREALLVLDKLVTSQPSIPRYRADLAGMQRGVGSFLDRRRKDTEAEEMLNAGFKHAERLVTLYPDRLEFHQLWAELCEALAKRRKSLSQPLEQLKWFRKRQDVLRDALARFPQAENQLRTALARAYADEGLLMEGDNVNRWQDALIAFDAALKQYHTLAQGKTAMQVQYHVEVGGLHVNRSLVYTSITNEDEKALPDLAQAIMHLEKAYEAGPDHGDARAFLLNALRTRAAALDRLNRPADAVKDWRRLVEVNRDVSRDLEWKVKLATALVRTGIADAWKPLEPWLKNPNIPGIAYLEIARVHALTAGLPDLPTAARTARQYQALDLLRAAEGRGCFKAAEPRQLLKTSKDWQSLHGWPEFEAWIKSLPELEASAP